ncbi:hypothetical protein PHSY_003334 [Pseudozyma hubeiensis SY62]|uniref:Bacteriophage T5 Orf172 DNA-binding domain-containing protein n=1 Tax=Pseudozyma hubeiensis (strain SY62) TaxID=1305764 RepID=R9P2V8_PSEHS|nr:hypothetical protein PHSY_003334 [Pseudozyma hubeiensis SY62]GAC95758.1 hypothetical protein PHSY_003334 [Pseudozyma hubeiensis SY62]
MAALGSPRDEYATTFLERALKRLHIRSPSSSLSQGSPSSSPSSSRAKPLPPPPKLFYRHAHDRAQQAANAPPYEYGAGSSSYTLPPTHPHLQQRPGPARIVLSHQHVDTSRLPPRPPSFVPQHVPPPSLRPASIPVGSLSAHKVAFPFELVPQSKERLSTSASTHGKENRFDPTVPSSEPKTPPRSRQREPVDLQKSGGGFLTPKGSQTDARHSPVKGQCWGIKKDGSRCTRKVRAADADGQNSSDVEEKYCFQHVAEAKKWPGFYHSRPPNSDASRTEVYVKYHDWLDDTVNDHTQALLRHCMSRSLTDTDGSEQGHLYVHELMSLSTSTHVCLKVGRSTQVFRRIGEWNSQCRSKQPLLRAIYPSHDDQQLMPGMDSPTMEGVYFSRRWEALVHLELGALGKRVDSICPDCGKRHREIFLIPRWLGYRDASRQEQNGGFEVARTAILKWLRFVQMLAAPDASAKFSVHKEMR